MSVNCLRESEASKQQVCRIHSGVKNALKRSGYRRGRITEWNSRSIRLNPMVGLMLNSMINQRITTAAQICMIFKSQVNCLCLPFTDALSHLERLYFVHFYVRACGRYSHPRVKYLAEQLVLSGFRLSWVSSSISSRAMRCVFGHDWLPARNREVSCSCVTSASLESSLYPVL